MAISALLIKQPFEVSFSGNPMPYSFAITPYGTAEKTQDIRLIIRIMVEGAPGFFNEVKSQQFLPDDTGQVNFDVSTIVDPYLDYLTPKPTMQRPLQATAQRKRYRINYLLQQNGALIGTVQSTTNLNAVKGGMAYDQWHAQEFFSKLILEDKQPLQFAVAGEKIFLNELRFVFWVYPFADNAVQTVMFDILLDDNSTIQYDLPNTITCGQWGVCCVPVQLSRVIPAGTIPTDRTIVSYTVAVKRPAGAIVAPITYTIDQRNFYDTSQLLYRNSAGGLETLTLRGQVDFEGDYLRQQAQRTVPPSYFTNGALLPQIIDANAEETPKFKGDTGFLNPAATDKLRDLFLSPQKFEVRQLPTANCQLLPISIITKNTKFFSNRENLITTLIEWQRAYVNEYYTPASLMPQTRACPPLETLQATQINKRLLQITYALQIPYDRVKIEIETSLGITTIYYSGNARTIRQSFINPVLDTVFNEDITIRAWCVCDEDTNPMELGPGSTLVLNVIGNTLPVAIDDIYNISVGYNTPLLLTSVLANDYDPDGDPIEVIARTGYATNAGGSYDIAANGTIYYLPVSSVYSGTDYFDYQIREVGAVTTVIARVYINVGTVTGQVFVKLVTRNNVFYGSSHFAEFWADYFADPAGTIPIDVTALALNIEINKHEFVRFTNCAFSDTNTTMYINPATGLKNKIWEGIYQSYVDDPSYPCNDELAIDFTIIPGAGYVVI